jgi:hypothetical protein
MKKLIFILFLSIVISANTPAQTNSYHVRNYSDTLPEAYKLDAAKLREQIYAGIPEKYKKDKYECLTYSFADQNAISICELISDGKVYSDWKPLENYLNAILEKIRPKELRNDSNVHAFVRQDGDFNAFMTPSGHMFINIGIFADISNEATIAGILCHEMGHYYFRHSLKFYLEKKAGTFKEGIIFKNKKGSQYSINNELEADSIGMAWFKQTGYSLKGLKNSFEIMVRMEKNAINRSKNKSELKETTHPSSEKRLGKMNDFMSNNKDISGKDFLVSEQLFNQLKEEAKPEILKNLLYSFEYPSCIEKAFKFHIIEPDNTVYIWYLMESIRRNCYLNNKLWNEMFITDRYYDKDKFKIKDHLFKNPNYEILCVNDDEAKDIKAKFYWEDKPRFTTYDQAFEFFYRVSQVLKDNECILSNALSFSTDKKSRDKFLELYLSKPNIKHGDYAKNLLENKIFPSLSKKKLIVLSDFETIVRQGTKDDKIEIPIRFNCPKIKNEIACIFDTLMQSNKAATPLFLKDYKKYHLNDFKMLSDMEVFTYIYTISKGEKTEIHILDPRFWEEFLKYDVNEIEFINCLYTEVSNADKNISSYKSIMNTDYNTIFSETYHTRFLDTYITSVREIMDGTMKTRYYGGSNSLKPKKSGYSQIISEIKEQMKEKDKKAIEFDRYCHDNL